MLVKKIAGTTRWRKYLAKASRATYLIVQKKKGFNPEENTKKKVAGSTRKEKRRWTESETLKLIDLLEERRCLCYEGQGLHSTLLHSFDRSVKQQQPTSPNNVA